MAILDRQAFMRDTTLGKVWCCDEEDIAWIKECTSMNGIEARATATATSILEARLKAANDRIAELTAAMVAGSTKTRCETCATFEEVANEYRKGMNDALSRVAQLQQRERDLLKRLDQCAHYEAPRAPTSDQLTVTEREELAAFRWLFGNNEARVIKRYRQHLHVYNGRNLPNGD